MFRGTFTALVTPFKNDEIDAGAFENLIEDSDRGGHYRHRSGRHDRGIADPELWRTSSCHRVGGERGAGPLPGDRRHRLQLDPRRDRPHRKRRKSGSMARSSSRPITTSRARKDFSAISPPSPRQPRSSSCSTTFRGAAGSILAPTRSCGWRRITPTSSRSRKRAAASIG